MILISPENGEIINLDARLSLELDKEAALFPWKVDYSLVHRDSTGLKKDSSSLIIRKVNPLEPIQDFNLSSRITRK